MKRTRQQAQDTRNQILDAAEWVFAEHGVAHTSLEDVAVRAGGSRAARFTDTFATRASCSSR
jgi:TetR/AcrR family acrAB operon transcriptional repressor